MFAVSLRCSARAGAQSPPEGLPGLVLRLLARDPYVAQQMIFELAQASALLPSLVHAQKRSQPSHKNHGSYCRPAPWVQDLTRL